MIQRFGGALLLAGGVTFGLFYLMQFLITMNMEKQEEQQGQVIDIVRADRETDVNTDRKKPKRQAKKQPPPPPMDMAKQNKPRNSADMGNMSVLLPDFRMQGGTGAGAAPSDADVMPIVRVQPNYPQRAAERGIEGWVLMEFSISKAGTVENPTVVDADPPNIFNRAAIRAVGKWKYKPKIEDGQPVERHGVQTVLTFELEDT